MDTYFDMMEMVGVVLLAGRWLRVEHTTADIEELGRDCMNFLLILFTPSVGKTLIFKATLPIGRILGKYQVIFNLSALRPSSMRSLV